MEEETDTGGCVFPAPLLYSRSAWIPRLVRLRAAVIQRFYDRGWRPYFNPA